MYGDGYELLGDAVGGGNTLISGNSSDIMYGDAAIVSATAKISGDTFEFMPHNGYDQIMDFHQGLDRIDLQGFGFGSFDQLAPHIVSTAHGELISFDATDSILVVGVSQLTPTDLLFT
jgi:Ca2+-binding RTX toxin-like protein